MKNQISRFSQKSKKIWLVIFENNWEYFSKIFLKKTYFGGISLFFFFPFFVIFATRKKNIFKK